MKKLFLQTAEIPVNDTTNLVSRIEKAIKKHSEWSFNCNETAHGCFMKPSLRNQPSRNSFIPEITVTASQRDGRTTLQLCGEPVRLVRYFIRFWLAAAVFFEIVALVIAVTSALEHPIFIFVPAAMFIFGYLLCELGTKFTFRSVVAAIQAGLQEDSVR